MWKSATSLSGTVRVREKVREGRLTGSGRFCIQDKEISTLPGIFFCYMDGTSPWMNGEKAHILSADRTFRKGWEYEKKG